MKNKKLLILLLVLLPSTLLAQTGIFVTEGVPFSYQAVTIDNTSAGVGISAATLTVNGVQAKTCFGVLETGDIRFRVDGMRDANGVVIPPTSTEGIPLTTNQFLKIDGFTALSRFRGIRQSGTSGVIRFTCSR